MANEKIATFAGADSIHIAKRGLSGVHAGFAGLTAANTGTGSGMRKVKGIQQAPNAVPEGVYTPVTGDNVRIRTFPFANADNASGLIEVATMDVDAEAAMQGSTVWALGNWSKHVRGITAPTLQDMIVLLHQDAVSEDPANPGQKGFLNTLYGSTLMIPVGPENVAFQAAGKTRYSTAFNPMTTWVTGDPFDADNFSVSDGLQVTWFSKYRTLFYTKIGNGTWDTIVVDYTPVDTASTKAFSFNGTTITALTVSGVTPATKTITLSAAPASGLYVVVEYEALRLS